jgi:crotonobetainyl-CoA:carnitine CoA-transferase CaiB-like acyl-CoA transferase
MFESLKVLELASVLAGPGVGQFFAELGAEVIKVENIQTGGDVTRTWKGAGEKTDDRSAYFAAVNWGKKSVALDLHQPADREIIYELIKDTDVVIASYKPGDAEKLGVDYKTLSAVNPRLIYGQITGYGNDNARVGYDAVLQAEAGFMSMNGSPGGPSLKMPVALIDVLAGHHLKEAILLAMLHRERTGKGDCVEVSLIQAAISSLANQATNWLVAGKLPKKQGSAHPNIAPYGDVFLSKDDKEILLAIGSDRQFQDLCSILDVKPISVDQKFRTNGARVENRLELNSILQSRIGSFVAIDLLKKIHELKIPAGLIQNVEEALSMKEASDLIIERDGLRGIANFAAKSMYNWKNKSSDMLTPPRLGEHTSEFKK